MSVLSLEPSLLRVTNAHSSPVLVYKNGGEVGLDIFVGEVGMGTKLGYALVIRNRRFKNVRTHPLHLMANKGCLLCGYNYSRWACACVCKL